MFRKKINLSSFQSCVDKLYKRSLTIAFAESMTAGYLSSVFSQGIYAASYFRGSVIAFDKSVKEELLGVHTETIAQFSAESIATSTAMIEGLQKLIPADIHIGVTGLAQPGGSENRHKPVGSVFIAVLYKEILYLKSYRFQGNSTAINIATLNFVVAEILLLLEEPYLKK